MNSMKNIGAYVLPFVLEIIHSSRYDIFTKATCLIARRGHLIRPMSALNKTWQFLVKVLSIA